MKSILLKVNDQITDELSLIQEAEGLGSRTSTITYLVKYYLLTKKSNLDNTLQLFDKLLDKVDTNALHDAEEQLKDL